MSTQRRQCAAHRGNGPNGRNLCFCGCGREVERPRRNWFSDKCVLDWQAINDPATIRRKVEERDHGICAACGVDTGKRAREANQWRPVFRWLAQRFLADEGASPWDAWNRADRYAADMIEDRYGKGIVAADGHTWEADHIVPVVEGGGLCGLENYRTMCLACHRKETAALAARRAARRRQEKEAAQLLLT